MKKEIIYILNKEEEIFKIIKKEYLKAKKIYIAVSYISTSGFNKIINLNNLKKEDKEFKIITTTDEFITDYNILKNFYESKNCKVKLINKEDEKRGFHTKFIIFEDDKGNITNINGSLNITKNAFENKYEVISIEQNENLLGTFNELWSKAREIDFDFLEKYKIKYSNYQKIKKENDQKLEHLILFNKNIMQQKVLKELEEVRRKENKKALLWAATGTGKTTLSAFDVEKIKANKVLYLVHSNEIINSVIKDYEKILPYKKILKLETKSFEKVDHFDVIFSTEKTLKNVIEKDYLFLKQFDYFIFDEVHKLGEKNIYNYIFDLIEKQLNNQKYFILGMSATPHRNDNKNFVFDKFKGNVVGKIDLNQAINQNLICNFKYYTKNTNLELDIKEIDEKIDKKDLNQMINSLLIKLKELQDENNDSIKLWKKEKIKGIIFTSNIEEANYVSEIMNQNGYNSVSLHSKNKQNIIKDKIKELEDDNYDLNFLVTVNQLNEGVDILKINLIVMFRSTQSNIIYTQQIGRGLRKYREKNREKYLNIIDLVSNYKNEKLKENNFNRILGLYDQNINPKKLYEQIKNDNFKFDSKNSFYMDEISKEVILESLKNASLQKYFENEIRDWEIIKNKKINIINFEEEIDESINIIVNNLKNNIYFNQKSVFWLSKIYRNKININKIKREEEELIEAFSWMPFTTSSPLEKEKIFNLIDGKEFVEFEEKWIEYFLGKTQYIKSDKLKNYFELKNNQIKFKINNNFSNEFIFLIKEIKNYLLKNINVNKKFILGEYYSKAEISFLLSHKASDQQNKNKDKNSKNIYYNHSILDKYKNEEIDLNKFIICTKNYKENIDYNFGNHFISFDQVYKWNKIKLFKYFGKASKIEKKDLYYDKKMNKEYNRFFVYF